MTKCWTLPLFFLLTAAPMAAAATPAPSIDQQFERTVKPFVGKYCVACHSGKAAPAQFDLEVYTSVKMVTDDLARWALLAERLKNQEMPPKPMPPPPAAEAQQVIDWVAAVRAAEIQKTAGDREIQHGQHEHLAPTVNIGDAAPDEGAEDGSNPGRQQNDRGLRAGQLPRLNDEREHECNQIVIEKF